MPSLSDAVAGYKIERGLTVELADLTPYPGNANLGNVEAVADSIAQHGQYRPLVVQASTGYVLAGNTTLKALQKLKRGAAVIDRLHVSDEQAAKINLVDNRSRDLATYDAQALAEQLANLGGDFTGTGYDQAAYDRVLEGLEGMGEGDPGSDLLEPDDAGTDAYDGAQFGVIVMCRDEEHQAAIYERLGELQGELDHLELRVVTV